MSEQTPPGRTWDSPRRMNWSANAPVVLVHPPGLSKRYLPTKVLPYGMAVLYAFLKSRGIPVHQYDFLNSYLYHSPRDPNYHSREHGFSQDEYLDHLQGRSRSPRLEAFAAKYADQLPGKAAIFAFSITAYPQYWAALLLAHRLKRVNPDALIVFGGAFITIAPVAELAGRGLADIWIKGSGERPLSALYRMGESAGGLDPARVPGTLFWRDGRVRQSKPERLPAGQEKAPDFSGLDLDSYCMTHPVSGREALFLPYRIAKGCVSRCSFCTGRLVDRFETKPLDKILAELERLAEIYGSRDFVFCDASINADPDLLARLCRRLPETLAGMSWYAYARVGGFDRRLLELAGRAGCFSLFWGVEAMHQPTVSLLGKGFRVERVRELLDQCRELKIKSHVHLMYHTPHESPEDARALRDLAAPLLDSPWVEFALHRFMLEPGSLMARRPGDFGLCDLAAAPQAVFERPKMFFGESPGLDPQGVRERESMIEAILGPLLAVLREREAAPQAPAPRL